MGKSKEDTKSIQGMHYRSFGDSHLPAVLMLHGGGLSGRMWDEVAGYLADYHVILPDLPGHGGSSQLDLSLEDCAQRLIDLVGQEANPHLPVHLVGLSLGGALALHLMQKQPDQFSRVAISGTSSGLSRVEALMNNLNAPLYNLPPSWLATLTSKTFGIPDRFHDQIVQATIPLKPATIKAMSRVLTEFKLPQAPAPNLLVLVGEKETRIALQSARKLSNQLQCEARRVPKAGHVWNFQMPQLFAETVSGWIENKELPNLQPLTL